MPIPRASEFFICGIEGLRLSHDEKIFLRNNPVGGIILFKRNIDSLDQLLLLNSEIIEANGDHVPVISVDQEGGRVARLKDICTDIPPMKELDPALERDPHLAYRLGAMQARELVAMGFNINFSPVCDVLSNPENQVIGDRAFSQFPEKVAIRAQSYIRGLQGGGVAACAKHFPGHGDTIVDSHLALPEFHTPMDLLKNRELLPFKAAIKADVAMVMTAHLINRALDNYPATLSHEIITNILRAELGFTNVVISDDLDMLALADNFDLEEIMRLGIRAGVDMFIIGNDFLKAKRAISTTQDLMDRDEEIASKLLHSSKRIEAMRKRFLGKPMVPDSHLAKSLVRSRPHLELLKGCR